MLLTFPDGTLYRSEAIAALPPLRYDWEAKRWILRVMLMGGHVLSCRSEKECAHDRPDFTMALLWEKMAVEHLGKGDEALRAMLAERAYA